MERRRLSWTLQCKHLPCSKFNLIIHCCILYPSNVKSYPTCTLHKSTRGRAFTILPFKENYATSGPPCRKSYATLPNLRIAILPSLGPNPGRNPAYSWQHSSMPCPHHVYIGWETTLIWSGLNWAIPTCTSCLLLFVWPWSLSLSTHMLSCRYMASWLWFVVGMV